MYKVMCETDSGSRSGKSGGVHYTSRPIGRMKPASKPKTAKARASKPKMVRFDPKASAQSPAIRDLVNRADATHAKFEIGYMDVDYMDVLAGESIIGDRKNLVAAYNTARKGRISSDADVAAFYIAYRGSPYIKDLNALDGRR